jgi:hypothetical protein
MGQPIARSVLTAAPLGFFLAFAFGFFLAFAFGVLLPRCLASRLFKFLAADLSARAHPLAVVVIIRAHRLRDNTPQV